MQSDMFCLLAPNPSGSCCPLVVANVLVVELNAANRVRHKVVEIPNQDRQLPLVGIGIGVFREVVDG